MKFIVVPGTSDPNTAYKNVYSALANEARERGFTDFILKNYPGHYSFDDKSFLSVSATVDIIRDSISVLEEMKEPYLVLCRSFGCVPFVEFLKSYKEQLIFMKKVVLWGVFPYYVWFRYFSMDFSKYAEVFIENGFRVKHELFNEIYPIELSISEIRRDFEFDILITSGSKDKDYSEHFRKFLIELNQNPKRIQGEGHAITKRNEEYFDLIFPIK